MQQPRFLRHLIYSFFTICIILMGGLSAQTAGELVKLYRNNQINELIELRRNDRIAFPDWKMFIDALFQAEAESATQTMMKIYDQSRDDELQSIIRERIALYYASRGYYETSRRILEDKAFFQKIVKIKNSRENPASSAGVSQKLERLNPGGNTFGIQVGAFSNYENAQKANEKFQQTYSNARVMEKEKSSTILYVVVIGGYATRQAAASDLPTINSKFKIKGYIIQY